MTKPRPDTPARDLLLDIEGTTTPLEFVHKVLFPYARAQVKNFLFRNASSPEVRDDLDGMRKEHAADRNQGLNPPSLEAASPEAELESSVAYIQWLIDRDRKSTTLKSLQGKIWEEGYRAGRLQSRVFPDVPQAFERWMGQRRRVSIFSSGSVLAQKLLFAHTDAGDLTKFIHAYFDTNIGAKADPESYCRIAATLERAPSEILFVSDVTVELDAARPSGMQTALCVRPGPAQRDPQPASHPHRVIQTFDEIFP